MTFLAITTTADRSRVVVSADEYVALPPEPARFEAIARTYEESYEGGAEPACRR